MSVFLRASRPFSALTVFITARHGKHISNSYFGQFVSNCPQIGSAVLFFLYNMIPGTIFWMFFSLFFSVCWGRESGISPPTPTPYYGRKFQISRGEPGITPPHTNSSGGKKCMIHIYHMHRRGWRGSWCWLLCAWRASFLCLYAGWPWLLFTWYTPRIHTRTRRLVVCGSFALARVALCFVFVFCIRTWYYVYMILYVYDDLVVCVFAFRIADRPVMSLSLRKSYHTYVRPCTFVVKKKKR